MGPVSEAAYQPHFSSNAAANWYAGDRLLASSVTDWAVGNRGAVSFYLACALEDCVKKKKLMGLLK